MKHQCELHDVLALDEISCKGQRFLPFPLSSSGFANRMFGILSGENTNYIMNECVEKWQA